MLKRSSGFVCPPIQKMIQDIHAETARFDKELRTSHREKIVLPVELTLMDDEIQKGFTRNVSATGVCIITFNPLEEMSNATMKIYRLANEPSHVLAECRWSKPFGERFWISGWQFLGIPRRS